jgi:hypothetical protein
MPTPEEIIHYHEAAQKGDIGILKAFIEKHPFDVDILSGADNRTALVSAAAYRGSHYLDNVEFLLTRGADPDARTQDGNSPLSAAIHNNSFQAVELICAALQIKYRGDAPALLDAALQPQRLYWNDPEGPRIRILDRSIDDPRYQDQLDAEARNRERKTEWREKIEQFCKELMSPKDNAEALSQGPRIRILGRSFEPPPQKLIVLSSPAMFSKAEKAMRAAKSLALPNLILDATLTLERLLQDSEGDSLGVPVLQIYAKHGKLDAIFTADIWAGRWEEMNTAWEHVPPQYRDQIDIETIRGQLTRQERISKRNVNKVPHL